MSVKVGEPLVKEVAVERVSATQWKWVSFEYHAARGSQVFIGGTFNRWRPSRVDKLWDRRDDGNYRTLLKLKKGRHEYNFLVDGAWLSDPKDSRNNNALDVV